MERIQKAQAFANQDKITAQFLYARKTMEINPNHPAIKNLKSKLVLLIKFQKMLKIQLCYCLKVQC